MFSKHMIRLWRGQVAGLPEECGDLMHNGLADYRTSNLSLPGVLSSTFSEGGQDSVERISVVHDLSLLSSPCYSIL